LEKLVSLLFALMLSTSSLAAGWEGKVYQTPFVNDWDHEVDFSCPDGMFIVGVYSMHHNHYEDRRFKFRCVRFRNVSQKSCKWTKWLNNWDRPVNFTCPDDGFLVGVNSIHHNHHEDRKFKYQCCAMYSGANKLIPSRCTQSDYTQYDSVINFTVPRGNAMTGVTSHHHNHYEDRQYSFRFCQAKLTGRH